jgi:3-hydroxyisobutyrate dehydrogenase-like beta-hydroxyacid dehydrogenase
MTRPPKLAKSQVHASEPPGQARASLIDEDLMSETIGFVGLGNMGALMARNLLAAGSRMVAHDVRAEGLAAVCVDGATVGPSPADVAASAELVFRSLPPLKIVEAVVCGPQGIVQGGKAYIVVDLSTSGPRMAARLSARLEEAGIGWADAPVSGGVPARPPARSR